MPLKVPAEAVGIERSVEAAINRVRKQQINVSINAGGINKLVRPLGKITGQAEEFDKSLAASNARILAFGAGVAVINGVSRTFENLLGSIIKVEKALADINIILGGSQSEINRFGAGIFEVARNTGQAFDEVATGALEFARQGLGVEESLRRVNDALILTRLTGIDAANAVEGLTAAVNNFGEAGLTTTDIINRLAAVDVQFAVSSEDLIEGLKRSSASAIDAKVDFDELVATITVLQERTARGGAVIGNALKTIFARIKTTDTLKALKAVGIEVQDAAGNIRPAIDILQDLATTVEDLSDIEGAAILEKVAGKRQRDILINLLKDLQQEEGKFASAVQTSSSATDEAIQKNKELNSTIAALINTTKVSLTELGAAIGETGFGDNIKEVISFFNGIIDGVKGLLNEETGSDIFRGFFAGLGNILQKVVLPLLAAIFVKLSRDLFKFGKDSVSSLLGINQNLKQQETLQESILATLLQHDDVLKEVLGFEGDRKKQAELLLGIYKDQVAQLEKVKGIAKAVTPAIFAAGLRGGPAGVGPPVKKSAGGFLPNTSRSAGGFMPAVAAESRDVSRGVGGASAGSKVTALSDFNFGGGKKGTMVVNTSEFLVKDYAGKGRGDAIFNQNMVKSMGLPTGATKINSAGGYVPNFAGSTLTPESLAKTKTLETLTSSLSKAKNADDRALFSGAIAIKKKEGKALQNKISKLEDFNLKGAAYQYGMLVNQGGVDSNPHTYYILKKDKGFRASTKITQKSDALGKVTLPVFGVNLADAPESNENLKKRYTDYLVKDTIKFAEKAGGGVIPNEVRRGQIKNLIEGGAAGAAAGTVFEAGIGAVLGDDDFKDFSATASNSIIDFKSGAIQKINGGKSIFDFKGRAPTVGLEAKGEDSQALRQSTAEKIYKVTGKKEDAFKQLKGRTRTAKVSSAASGYIPNFATGIYDGDQIKDTAVKKQILARILSGNKRVNATFGPSGVGKTTMALKGGGTFIKTVSALGRYDDFNVVSGAGKTKAGGFSAGVGQILDAVKRTGGKAEYLYAPRAVIEARREGRDSIGSDIRSEKALAATKFAPKNQFSFVKALLKRGVKPVRVGSGAKGFVPNFAYTLGKNKDNIAIRSVTSPLDKRGVRKRGTGAVRQAIVSAVSKAKESGFEKITANIISASSLNAFKKYFGRAQRGKNTWNISEFKGGVASGANGFVPNFAGLIRPAVALGPAFNPKSKSSPRASVTLGPQLSKVSIRGPKNNGATPLRLPTGITKALKTERSSGKSNGKRSLKQRIKDTLLSAVLRGARITNNADIQRLLTDFADDAFQIAQNIGLGANGFVPNFSALSDAIGREKAAGLPLSKIRVGQDNRLINKSNPTGIGVTNTRDEPRGMKDVPNARIPNFAIPKIKIGGKNDKNKPQERDAIGSILLLQIAAQGIAGAFGSAENSAAKFAAGLSTAVGAVGTAVFALGPLRDFGSGLKESKKSFVKGIGGFVGVLGPAIVGITAAYQTIKLISNAVLEYTEVNKNVRLELAKLADVSKDLAVVFSELSQKRQQEIKEEATELSKGQGGFGFLDLFRGAAGLGISGGPIQNKFRELAPDSLSGVTDFVAPRRFVNEEAQQGFNRAIQDRRTVGDSAQDIKDELDKFRGALGDKELKLFTESLKATNLALKGTLKTLNEGVNEDLFKKGTPELRLENSKRILSELESDNFNEKSDAGVKTLDAFRLLLTTAGAEASTKAPLESKTALLRGDIIKRDEDAVKAKVDLPKTIEKRLAKLKLEAAVELKIAESSFKALEKNSALNIEKALSSTTEKRKIEIDRDLKLKINIENSGKDLLEKIKGELDKVINDAPELQLGEIDAKEFNEIRDAISSIDLSGLEDLEDAVAVGKKVDEIFKALPERITNAIGASANLRGVIEQLIVSESSNLDLNQKITKEKFSQQEAIRQQNELIKTRNLQEQNYLDTLGKRLDLENLIGEQAIKNKRDELSIRESVGKNALERRDAEIEGFGLDFRERAEAFQQGNKELEIRRREAEEKFRQDRGDGNPIAIEARRKALSDIDIDAKKLVVALNNSGIEIDSLTKSLLSVGSASDKAIDQLFSLASSIGDTFLQAETAGTARERAQATTTNRRLEGAGISDPAALSRELLEKLNRGEVTGDFAFKRLREINVATTGRRTVGEESAENVAAFKEEFAEEVPRLFKDNLNSALQSAIVQAEDLKSALLGAAKSFLDEINSRLISNAVDSLFAKPKDGGSGGGGGFLSKIGGFLGFNSGGRVNYGSGTKDDAPALLTKGEYVINKNSVNKYGAGFFESLNAGSVPKFASGGGFFIPGTRGQGEIRGKKDLLEFALQESTAGLTDRRFSTSNAAGINLEDQSRALSFAALSRNSPINNRLKAAQEQAFGLRGQQIEQEQEAKRIAKEQKDGFIRSLLTTVALGGLKLGVNGLKQGFNFAKNGAASGGTKLSRFFEGFKAGAFGVDDVSGASKAIVVPEISSGSGEFQGTGSRAGRADSGGGFIDSLKGFGGGVADLIKSLFRAKPNQAQAQRGGSGGFNPTDFIRGGDGVLPQKDWKRIFSGRQQGGVVGDTVPAMLNSGEFVLNKGAVQSLGKERVQALNSGVDTSGGDFSEVGDRIVSKLEEVSGSSRSVGDININVTIQKDGSVDSGQSDSRGEQDGGNENNIGNQIRDAVIAILQDEQRLGGVLRR